MCGVCNKGFYFGGFLISVVFLNALLQVFGLYLYLHIDLGLKVTLKSTIQDLSTFKRKNKVLGYNGIFLTKFEPMIENSGNDNNENILFSKV